MEGGGGGGSRLLPSLGLLQLLLGGSIVALSFGALSLSSSPSLRNSCPFWAGFSVILLGVVGLATWRRPMLLLVNVFFLLSVVCVVLNVAGFILCCQGAQLVSSMNDCQLGEEGDVCYCCSSSHSSTCTQMKLLKLHPGNSCSTTRVLLKKVLIALCALNALTTAVCLMAPALRYLQIFTTGTPCMAQTRTPVEEREEPTQIPDPDEFVAPAPPPSYFSTFYSSTPRLAHQMLGDSKIYGAGIKGVEVCPLEPPPPYEAVTQEAESTVIPVTTRAEASVGVCSSCDAPLASSPQTADFSVQIDLSTLAAQTQGQVTLRRDKNNSRTPHRPRPSSMVDYQSYRHTQQLVRTILEQPAAQGLAPEVQELVDSIRNVLRSDQEHMEEAVRCASYIEQVFTESETSSIHPKKSQQQPGDGGSCSKAVSRAVSHLDQADRPHSLIGVFRETML